MAKVVCVLYDDPVDGYPRKYALDDIPKLERYPSGQSLPTPEVIDFKPGQLLGSVSGALGLKKFLKSAGHKLVVTADKGLCGSFNTNILNRARAFLNEHFDRTVASEELEAVTGLDRYSLARDIENLQRNVRAGRLGRDAFPLLALVLLAAFLGEHFFAKTMKH